MTRPTPRSRNAEIDFRAGAGAMLCFMGHTLMQNRHGLIVQADLTQADRRAERSAAIDMIDRHSPGSTRRPFGWAKTVGGMAQTMLRGGERVRARFPLTRAACNLARLPRLLAA